MINETYPEEYLDINFLSNILFDYVYNPKTERCYNIEKINLENINISDIKLQLDTMRQKQIINNILNTDITFLYRNQNKYVYKYNQKIYSINIELQLYLNNDLDNLKSSENMNSLMTYILSDLVVNKLTKNILLNLMCIDINLNLLDIFLSKNQELSELNENSDKKNKIIKITISEHFFKMDNLDLIVNDLSDKQINSIIYQLMFLLSLIQTNYPGFRHNLLKISAIKIYYKNPKITNYNIGNNNIINMNNEGIEIKLTNFNESLIIGKIDNDDIELDKKEINNTYDILIFLKDLENKITKKNIKNNIKKIINYINNFDKNILFSNIIMNKNFKIQDGGKKHKNRTITGYRYLNEHVEDVIYREKKELPDSLSSESFVDDKYKFNEELDSEKIIKNPIKNISMQGMPMYNMPGMNMPGMNMPGMNMSGMNMPGMNMPGMNMPGMNIPGMNMPGMNMPGMNMPMTAPMQNMGKIPSHDQLTQLGVLPPSMSSLPMTSAQAGGNKNKYIDLKNTSLNLKGGKDAEYTESQYIDINNFFF